MAIRGPLPEMTTQIQDDRYRKSRYIFVRTDETIPAISFFSTIFSFYFLKWFQDDADGSQVNVVTFPPSPGTGLALSP
jgi:hypothetical protein